MEEGKKAAEKVTIVAHSGDMDKLYSALIIANGGLAMGMEASIFFTFWGLERLKKGGLEKGPLSKMHMLGLGKLIVGALNDRDYSMLQGLMVVYAFFIVVTNLLTDLTYGFTDPRVKRQ